MTEEDRPLNGDEQELIRLAREIRERAYAPYSNFKVGAALRVPDGRVFLGCNVENSSYGLTICAERSAAVQAVAAGYYTFSAIAVVAGESDAIVTPCGACRQFLSEFPPDFPVYLQVADPSGTVVVSSVGALLPGAFHFGEHERVRDGRGQE